MNLNKPKQLVATALATVLPLEHIFKITKNRYILAYHRVIPPALARKFNMQDSMWISVDTFNDDIVWMQNHGDIVDLDTILDFGRPNDRPLFSITFDDGWIDNYDYAFPIIKKHAIPATIFLVTEAIETGHIFWVEDFLYKVAQLSSQNHKINNILLSYYIKANSTQPDTTDTKHLAEGLAEIIKPFPKDKRTAFLIDLYHDLKIETKPINDQILSWSKIIEMSTYGIEFGSHTHTHEILQYADDDIITKELETSKNIIAERISKPVKYFCYPNARYREENVGPLGQAGYDYAFRIHNLHLTKNQNNYFVPRFLLNERVCHNKNYMLCRLLGFPKF